MVLFEEIKKQLASAEGYFSSGDFYSSLTSFEKLKRIRKSSTTTAYDSDDCESDLYDDGLILAEEAFVKSFYFYSEKRFFLSFREMALAIFFAKLLSQKDLFFSFSDKKEQNEFISYAKFHKNCAYKRYQSLPPPITKRSKILSLEPEEKKASLVSLLNERDIANLSGNQAKVFNLDRIIWDIYHIDPNLRFEPFFT